MTNQTQDNDRQGAQNQRDQQPGKTNERPGNQGGGRQPGQSGNVDASRKDREGVKNIDDPTIEEGNPEDGQAKQSGNRDRSGSDQSQKSNP